MTIADIEALGYEVGIAQERDDGTKVYFVSGFGVQTYVAGDDQEAIDSLADPAGHTERKFQQEQPDAHEARVELRGKGYEVERGDPTTDLFDVSDGNVVVASAVAPGQLPELAGSLPNVP